MQRMAAIVAALCLAMAPGVCVAQGQATFVAYDAEAKELIAKMTLEEKVGQMVQVDISFLSDPK